MAFYVPSALRSVIPKMNDLIPALLILGKVDPPRNSEPRWTEVGKHCANSCGDRSSWPHHKNSEMGTIIISHTTNEETEARRGLVNHPESPARNCKARN